MEGLFYVMVSYVKRKIYKIAFLIDWQDISTCVIIVMMKTFHYQQIFDQNTVEIILQWKKSKKKD